eukprot:2491092-Pleurochrysis_carterae.AAC.1
MLHRRRVTFEWPHQGAYTKRTKPDACSAANDLYVSSLSACTAAAAAADAQRSRRSHTAPRAVIIVS